MILPEEWCPRGRAGGMLGRSAVLVLAAALAGCTALSEQDLTPPQATVVKGAQSTGEAAGGDGPRRTGAYPSFSEPLRAANVQMENDQAAQIEARLSALGHARASGQVTEAEYQRRLAELRRLARQHGPETEAAIAN